MMPKPARNSFRLGIRAIVHVPLAVAYRDGCCHVRRLQSRAAHKDAGSFESLTVSPPSRGSGCLLAPLEVFP